MSSAEDPPIGNMIRPRSVSRVCEEVKNQVGEACQKGELPVVLGGDHSLAMGTIAGSMSKYPDACVVWVRPLSTSLAVLQSLEDGRADSSLHYLQNSHSQVDAHADINTPDSTTSGNLHGCPVSFLLGLSGTNIEPFSKWMSPCLKPENLVYIGLRDVDAEEKKIIRELGIKAFSMHDVDKHGIGKVVEMALDAVNPARDKPIHLSYDVDALDVSPLPFLCNDPELLSLTTLSTHIWSFDSPSTLLRLVRLSEAALPSERATTSPRPSPRPACSSRSTSWRSTRRSATSSAPARPSRSVAR